MGRNDPAALYFERVYPFLRGAHGPSLGAQVTRRVTEPGQSNRLDWVLAELADCPARRVLDAGCGTGVYAAALAARGHDVTALDLSESMLRATAATAAATGVAHRVHQVRADLRAWQPDTPFDVVLCMGVAEYYRDADRILERLFSWTRERLLVSFSGTRGGMRVVLRRAWLRCHGVEARLLRANDLEHLMSALPEARVQVHEMPWAHCASAIRTPVADHHRPPINGAHAIARRS